MVSYIKLSNTEPIGVFKSLGAFGTCAPLVTNSANQCFAIYNILNNVAMSMAIREKCWILKSDGKQEINISSGVIAVVSACKSLGNRLH